MANRVTQLRVGAKTDPGLKRELNEDDFIVVEQFKDREALAVAEKKGDLCVVADGVGGHNAGEVASRMAVDIISQEYYEDDSPDVKASLCQAIQQANRRIYERAQSVRSETGMGSTVVAAVIRGDELYVAHVGDSRAYLLRGETIKQLTVDHTWIGEQMAQGLITSDEARTHPYRSYITRSLGAKPEVEVDCTAHQIQKGDIVLLCSDGLSGPVDDQVLKRISLSLDPPEACEELVRLANEAGGPDNITAIVIQADKVVPTLHEYRPPKPTPTSKPKDRQRERKKRKPLWAGCNRSTKIIVVVMVAILTVSGVLLAGVLWRENQRLHWQMNSTATALAATSATTSTETPAWTPTLTSTPTPIAAKDATPAGTRPVAMVFTTTPTATPSPTSTPTDTPTPTSVPTNIPTPTSAPTNTPTSTGTSTHTPTPTSTSTNTPAPTSTCKYGPYPVPGRVEAEDYTCGGDGIAYHDTTSGNFGRQHRSDDVDIEICREGGYNVSYTANDEWLAYTIEVTSADLYDIAVRVATSDRAGARFALEVDEGDVIVDVDVPNTGGPQNWTTVTVEEVLLTAGLHTLQLYVVDAWFNINYLEFITVGPTGPVLTPTLTPMPG